MTGIADITSAILLLLVSIWPPAEFLAGADRTLKFRWSPVENYSQAESYFNYLRYLLFWSNLSVRTEFYDTLLFTLLWLVTR